MSIIRWGEQGSSIFVIGPETNRWECVGCSGPDAYSDHDTFVKHLAWHRDRGDCVPDIVESRLAVFK